MSQQNVEVIRAVYDRFGSGDFRASMDTFDPQISFIVGPGFPEAGHYRGIAAIAEYTRGFLEPWSEISIQAEEIIDGEDAVLAAVRQSGIGSESGAATEFRYFQVWSFRADRVVRLENFRDRAAARAAAGLTE